MRDCEYEIRDFLKKLAEFCNDGEAIEVTIGKKIVKVKSLDVKDKTARFVISPECRQLLIYVLKSGASVEV